MANAVSLDLVTPSSGPKVELLMCGLLQRCEYHGKDNAAWIIWLIRTDGIMVDLA